VPQGQAGVGRGGSEGDPLSLSDGGWYGVDFDGTLAVYEDWGKHGLTPGPPIPAMLARVKGWLAEGIPVRIFTARVSHIGQDDIPRLQQQEVVRAWLREHLGQELPITACKDFQMVALWDDRAIQVEQNTGRRMDGQE
jgi:hypothetical protein